MPTARWCVTFLLTAEAEGIQATLYSCETGQPRTIIRTVMGPFDSPEDVLSTYIEMIDHAYWNGEQLKLPEQAPSE